MVRMRCWSHCKTLLPSGKQPGVYLPPKSSHLLYSDTVRGPELGFVIEMTKSKLPVTG